MQLLDKVDPQDLLSSTTMHTVGRVTLLRDSHQVQGEFTKWLPYVFQGCYLYIPGDDTAYRVAQVLDNHNLDLTVPYEGLNRYHCQYIVFVPPKKWMRCECDKKVVAADGMDKVTFMNVEKGTRIRITKDSDYLKEVIVSESTYEFMPQVKGAHNFKFTAPGYHPRQIVITAV